MPNEFVTHADPLSGECSDDVATCPTLGVSCASLSFLVDPLVETKRTVTAERVMRDDLVLMKFLSKNLSRAHAP